MHNSQEIRIPCVIVPLVLELEFDCLMIWESERSLQLLENEWDISKKSQILNPKQANIHPFLMALDRGTEAGKPGSGISCVSCQKPQAFLSSLF